MNKTSIEWCDYTWNPVTGCLHGCPYCYARKIAERFTGSKAWPEGFKPTFHPERLKDPRKAGTQYYCPSYMAKGSTIFVCSMADLFGEWVPKEWTDAVFKACLDAPWHTYIFLTKNPEGYFRAIGGALDGIPDAKMKNWWFGVSVSGKENIDNIEILKMLYGNRFISFEPLLSDPGILDLSGIRQVIIGAQTNPDQCANLESVLKICEAGDRVGAKVFMKDSLAGRWPDRALRRELVWEIHK
jgi:protein gp37